MLNIKSLLEFRYHNGSTYTDYKKYLGKPTGETASITLTSATDTIWIGYSKPIKQIYFDFSTVNTNSNVITLKYNSTAIEIYDSTNGFTQNGFIQWEELSDWDAETVDGDEKYWLELTVSADHSAAVYNFAGLLFSDDNDLQLENPYILESNLLMGESSHLKANVAARDKIVQKLTNRGYIINSNELLGEWDLLDVNEVNQASKYAALSIIYFNLSDSDEDAWMKKSDKYNNLYKASLKLARLSLDLDDDGITDTIEKAAPSICRRVVR